MGVSMLNASKPICRHYLTELAVHRVARPRSRLSATPDAALQELSRRIVLNHLALAATAPLSLRSTAWAAAGAEAQAGTCDAASPSSRKLSGRLAANFNAAVYTTVLSMKLGDAVQFQKDVFKLRDQEYPYYYQNNKQRLPALPDLSDMSGGLSNPTYFNFISYILWKVASRRLPTAEMRTAFGQAYGQELLSAVWPEAGAEAASAAEGEASLPRELPVETTTSTPEAGALMRVSSASVPVVRRGRANEIALLGLVVKLLDKLQGQGYICRYQVVWGETPGSWPADWMVSEPLVVGAAPTQADAAGLNFQVKLYLPADLEGGVALRAEADGFWSRAASSMLARLVQLAGYHSGVDEYFFQDSWSGPQRKVDQLLLFFGDPLQLVDVPWTPTTLVQDWQLT